jgi:hypothetical protein
LAFFFANNLPWIINEIIIILKKELRNCFSGWHLGRNLYFKERPQLTLINSRTTIPNKEQTYVLGVPITNAK